MISGILYKNPDTYKLIITLINYSDILNNVIIKILDYDCQNGSKTKIYDLKHMILDPKSGTSYAIDMSGIKKYYMVEVKCERPTDIVVNCFQVDSNGRITQIAADIIKQIETFIVKNKFITLINNNKTIKDEDKTNINNKNETINYEDKANINDKNETINCENKTNTNSIDEHNSNDNFKFKENDFNKSCLVNYQPQIVEKGIKNINQNENINNKEISIYDRVEREPVIIDEFEQIKKNRKFINSNKKYHFNDKNANKVKIVNTDKDLTKCILIYLIIIVLENKKAIL